MQAGRKMNFQDRLYNNGSLSTVWIVGTGAKYTKGCSDRTKLGKLILRVNIEELCDSVMSVAQIPDFGRGQGNNQGEFMDIKKLAILLYGLHRIHFHQLKAFKKSLDATYEKIKWRAPPSLDVCIDLPTARRKIASIRMESPLMSMELGSFGEMNFDIFDNPLLPGLVTPRRANLGETLVPHSSQHSEESFVDINQLDIVNIITSSSSKNPSRRKHDSTAKQVASGALADVEILRWLATAPNVANRPDITIKQHDLVPNPRTIPQLEDEFSNFENEHGASTGFAMNPFSAEMPLDNENTEIEPQGLTDIIEIQDVNMNLEMPQTSTPARPVVVNIERLEKRIRIDESTAVNHPPTTDSNSAAPGRKNARITLKPLSNDRLIQIPVTTMKDRINNGDPTIGELLDRAMDRTVQTKISTLPTNLPAGKKSHEIILNHWGRQMGIGLNQLLQMIKRNNVRVARPRPTRSEDKEEQRRSDSEGPGHFQKSTSSPLRVSAGRRESEIRRPDTRAVVSEVTSTLKENASEAQIKTLQTFIDEEVSVPAGGHTQMDVEYNDATLIPFVEHCPSQSNTNIAEELGSPRQPAHPGSSRGPMEDPIPLSNEEPVYQAYENNSEGPSFTFRHLCPESTSRQKAASTFARLLSMQKEKKILLVQDSFCGPITIKPLIHTWKDSV